MTISKIIVCDLIIVNYTNIVQDMLHTFNKKMSLSHVYEAGLEGSVNISFRVLVLCI